MSEHRPSQWPLLFETAAEIIAHAEQTLGAFAWSFGGGTALMLQIDHRESFDIDLFLDDPQILPFLNPETQEIPLERKPDGYHTDGARVLKLAYQDVGEIDFICCSSITHAPTFTKVVRGQEVALETAGEIIAKKVYYRGGSFQPRDMFDLAAVTEHDGMDSAVSALVQCGQPRCETALGVIERANPEFVRSIMEQLMAREKTRHLVDRAQGISADVLRKTLAALA